MCTPPSSTAFAMPPPPSFCSSPAWDYLLREVSTHPIGVEERLHRLFQQVEHILNNCNLFMSKCLQQKVQSNPVEARVGEPENFISQVEDHDGEVIHQNPEHQNQQIPYVEFITDGFGGEDQKGKKEIFLPDILASTLGTPKGPWVTRKDIPEEFGPLFADVQDPRLIKVETKGENDGEEEEDEEDEEDDELFADFGDQEFEEFPTLQPEIQIKEESEGGVAKKKKSRKKTRPIGHTVGYKEEAEDDEDYDFDQDLAEKVKRKKAKKKRPSYQETKDEDEFEVKEESRSKKMYNCDQCPYITKYKPNFETHMNRHNGIKPYLCEKCHKSYFTNTGLDIHIQKVHLNKREYSCLECDKHFCTKGEYTRHMKYGVAHMKKDLVSVCHLCGKSFANAIRLKVHLQGFHGNKLKGCPHCGKYFKCLDVHIAHKHTGMPVQHRHKCTICNERFETKKLMLDHKADVHNVSLWHCCDRCEYKFTSSARLSYHVKIVHMKEKATCPGCFKDFSEYDSVKKHIKEGRCKGAMDESIRLQYLNNTCPKCHKQFGRATVLAKHIEAKSC